jgi:hypothetical protein
MEERYMEGIFNILEGFEKLAYRILIWIILIPKTLIQIIVNPSWAPDYIKGELKQEKNPFDEYNSPVVLMLVVALIPALLINLLPETGVTITRPDSQTKAHEGTIESWLSKNNRAIQETYEAEANFTSSSTKMKYEFAWYVEKVVYDEQGNIYYEIVSNSHEVHRESDDSGYYITHVDNNTAQDQYFYSFPSAGEFYINVTAAKIDPKTTTPLESYENYIYVFVPEETDLKGYIEDSRIKDRQSGGSNKPPLETLSGLLKKETTIFLAIGMMLPPLLYAFATRLITRKEISENSLKEVFYAQCYYFSPLQLAVWAFVYSISFFTDDLFSYKEWAFLLILVPPLLALGWFISVQINALVEEGKEKKEGVAESAEQEVHGFVDERQEEKSRISRFVAFLVVNFCLAIVFGAVILIINFSSDPQMQDNIRKSAIWFYLMGTAGLIVAYLIRWDRKRRLAKRRFTFANLFLVGPLSLISIIIIWAGVVPGNPPEAAPTLEQVSEPAVATEISVDTPTAKPTQMPEATPTLPAAIPDIATPTSPAYYTEEFDGDLSTWKPFVMGGEDSMVDIIQAESKLEFQIFPRDNKSPSFYMVNESFSYTDVSVQMVADNTGNNANGVSLVCRYSGDSWYEFTLSSSGYYAIFVHTGQEGFTLLKDGGSPSIRTGQTTNTYTAICRGNELSLLINGTVEQAFTETRYGLADGLVGVGVSSPSGLPVSVAFDSFTVSAP